MDERACGAISSMVRQTFYGYAWERGGEAVFHELICFCQFIAELFIYPDEMLTIDN